MRIHGKWCFARISFRLATEEHYSLMVLSLDQEVFSSLWLAPKQHFLHFVEKMKIHLDFNNLRTRKTTETISLYMHSNCERNCLESTTTPPKNKRNLEEVGDGHDIPMLSSRQAYLTLIFWKRGKKIISH